jgi:sugar lactone lactonase YvrE
LPATLPPQGSVDKVSPDGTLSIIADYNIDGLGSSGAVTGDANGDLYVTNATASVVDEIAAINGTVSVIAGGGVGAPSTTPQLATSVKLGNPDGVAVDTSGGVFIADASLAQGLRGHRRRALGRAAAVSHPRTSPARPRSRHPNSRQPETMTATRQFRLARPVSFVETVSAG